LFTGRIAVRDPPGVISPPRIHRVRVTPFVVAAILNAGCYYYRPTETPTPAPTTFVSMALTDSGTDQLWRYLGPEVGALRGRLLATEGGSYAMSVYAVDLRNGTTLGWKGERVVVSRGLVSGMSERHFSLGRTALTSGLSAAGFVLTLQAFKVFGGGGSSAGGGGKPR
jgi:hypothetical protein